MSLRLPKTKADLRNLLYNAENDAFAAGRSTGYDQGFKDGLEQGRKQAEAQNHLKSHRDKTHIEALQALAHVAEAVAMAMRSDRGHL